MFGLLQILPRAEVEALFRRRLREWAAPGCLLVITAWHEGDPSHEKVRREWRRDARLSYVSDAGDVRTYLGYGEAAALLSDWELVHHAEYVGRPHRHGDGPEHRHGRVDIVALRDGERPAI